MAGQDMAKKKYTAKEIIQGWLDFKPRVPITFLIAARKAAKEK